jgi:hypothetical protein
MVGEGERMAARKKRVSVITKGLLKYLEGHKAPESYTQWLKIEWLERGKTRQEYGSLMASDPGSKKIRLCHPLDMNKEYHIAPDKVKRIWEIPENTLRHAGWQAILTPGCHVSIQGEQIDLAAYAKY